MARKADKTWVYVEPYLYKNADSGRYYSRFGRQGFRALRTDRISVARLRMGEGLGDHKAQTAFSDTCENGDVLMDAVIEDFNRITKESLALGNIAQRTADDRAISLLRLERTWPGIRSLTPHQITQSEVKQWADRAASTRANSPPGAKRKKGVYSLRAVEKAAGILRMLMNHAVTLNAIASAPVVKINSGARNRRKTPKELPSRSILRSLFEELQYPRNREIRQAVIDAGGTVEGKTQEQLAEELGIAVSTYKRHKTGTTVGNGKETADFARLLVFTGMRVDEARNLTWADINLQKGEVKVRKGKTPSSRRTIPMIAEARTFFESLKRGAPIESVVALKGINRALAAASERLGIPKLTHHSLRHLFATICIESGVDIPTVSRWLGHSDGGALAMRVYGHLRDEHSQLAAQKVRVFE
jgi:integrase